MSTPSALLKKYKYTEEEIEAGMDFKGNTVFAKTGFPIPKLTYKVVHQIFNQSIEENYFHDV